MSSSLRYFALPTQPCTDVADNIAHLAHVHTPDGVKSVCPGLLPHSVPMNDVICADPDCGSPNCTGEHGPIRCTRTGELNTMVATSANRWTCCGGTYPNHERAVTTDPASGQE